MSRPGNRKQELVFVTRLQGHSTSGEIVKRASGSLGDKDPEPTTRFFIVYGETGISISGEDHQSFLMPMCVVQHSCLRPHTDAVDGCLFYTQTRSRDVNNSLV